MNKNYQFETLQIHAGQKPDPVTKATGVPLYLSNAFTFDDADQAKNIFALEEGGYFYSRLSNPTVDVLQQRMAALDGGVAAVAFSSGTAAIMGLIMTVCQSGDEIIAANNLYGGTIGSLSGTMAGMGFVSHFVNPRDLEAIESLINEKTKLIFVESVGNPNGDMLDFDAISMICKKYGILFVVDNTTPTPYLFRPIEHGADLVVYSTTKYIAGHGNVMGGIIVDSGKFNWHNDRYPLFTNPDKAYHDIIYADLNETAFSTKAIAKTLRDLGGCMSPFNAYMTLLGLETLSLRMAKHVDNSRKIAQFLNDNDAVEWVSYAELEGHESHDLCQKYFPCGFGGLFTFGVKGGIDSGKTVINHIQLFTHVTNFADSRSLLTHPASTTHAQMSEEERLAGGVQQGTIRISVGLEDPGDLIADLQQAFDQI
ncbi:O-acetylhomoserine aminocarboxypropyltransferase/cysteine synthase family protein [Candidatus Stoquefichus massiliensis]|uniref:O-acetylhomoserine aminocarboxypropyltransferase/cysteine synthase family protein n=1 Tax=Candidatus Stoquefichus massiliensis TaxID=1470350 RepID=UPI000481DE0B|nr:O-acetylhomoserine aminocarboxypropyltransferase/cysteine synthase family protein [Candidatus Stoquefichus massiliensis]